MGCAALPRPPSVLDWRTCANLYYNKRGTPPNGINHLAGGIDSHPRIILLHRAMENPHPTLHPIDLRIELIV